MASTNITATITEARVETHPTTGVQSVVIQMKGPIGAAAIAVATGATKDRSTAPAVAALVGLAVTVAIDDDTHDCSGITYTP